MKKYFFDQDSDFHWYMIPSELRGRWSELQNMPEGYDKDDLIIEEFSGYMTGGGITDIDFLMEESEVEKILE